MNRARHILSLVCNVFIFAVTLYFSVLYLDQRGPSFLKWFTTLSNMLMALGCIAAVPFNIKAIVKGTALPEFPHWLQVAKFAGTTAVTVTMVTVLTFLNYLVGLPSLLTDEQLYFHLINPLLALLTCCVLERLGKGIARWEWLWGVLPLAIYSIVYLVLVLIVGPDNGGWNDFYGFNKVPGMWPISLVCMWVGATLIGLLVWKLSGGKGRARDDNRD